MWYIFETVSNIGEMAERSKAAVLKTVEGIPLPGFESLSLRTKKDRTMINKTNAKHTVLVVDDHELVRAGIVSLLSNLEDIIIVDQASTGEEAIQKAQKHQHKLGNNPTI